MYEFPFSLKTSYSPSLSQPAMAAPEAIDLIRDRSGHLPRAIFLRFSVKAECNGTRGTDNSFPQVILQYNSAEDHPRTMECQVSAVISIRSLMTPPALQVGPGAAIRNSPDFSYSSSFGRGT